jgi:methyl halide transferase
MRTLDLWRGKPATTAARTGFSETCVVRGGKAEPFPGVSTFAGPAPKEHGGFRSPEVPTSVLRGTGSRIRIRLAGWLTAAVIGLGVAWPASGQTEAADNSLTPCLHASEILDFQKSFRSTNYPGDAYVALGRLVFAGSAHEVLAFEQNRSFDYVLGTISASRDSQNQPPTGHPAKLVRRMIFLRPWTFIVDDQILDTRPGSYRALCLYSERQPQTAGHRIRVREGGGELSCETLLPMRVNYRVERQPESALESERYRLETVSQNDSSGSRFLWVFHTGGGDSDSPKARSELTADHGQLKLTISEPHRVFQLNLPPPGEGAGEIAISTANGENLVASRPLPSGVLPHGPAASRLLEEWDSAYRAQRPAAWDIGRPARELQRAVSEGAIRPCRIVDLCCGSGTDAVYLAKQGFEVTAIDIAPTALSLAQQKAREAGASVQWLLADVLAPPKLKPFDVIYDRGCYHVVRDQNLTAYIETIRRLSHPGTQFLLLAARSDEDGTSRNQAGVTEDELRFDFLGLFEVEWLRDIRLESNEPGREPPGWSALLRRQSSP